MKSKKPLFLFLDKDRKYENLDKYQKPPAPPKNFQLSCQPKICHIIISSTGEIISPKNYIFSPKNIKVVTIAK